MRRLDRLWLLDPQAMTAVASAVFLAWSLAGCAGAATAPATAKAFADRYPPIRDPNLVRYILDHRDEIERGFHGDKDTVRHVYGQGRDQVIITEYLVKGVPFKIERSRREYGDLLGDLPAKKVDRIVVGFFISPMPGRFVITDQQEIAEAIHVIRGGTYCLRYDFAYRDMVKPDSAGETIPGEHGPDKRFWGTGCGQGIQVILKDGEPSHWPKRWEWLGYEARAYHHHEGLLELLDRLTRKHGWVMYEGPHNLVWFRPPPEELIPFLSSGEYNRALALKMLADWGPRASCAIGELEKLQSDPSEKVRRAAAHVLERIRGPSSRPVSSQAHP